MYKFYNPVIILSREEFFSFSDMYYLLLFKKVFEDRYYLLNWKSINNTANYH